MDLNALIRLIFIEKNEVTLGVLIGLLLLVVFLLLVRSVMEEKEGAAGNGKPIDAKAINTAVEGAFKKILADKGGLIVATGTGATAASSGPGAEAGDPSVAADAIALKQVLSEREAKIAVLMSDLEALKAQVDARANEVSPGGGVAKTGEQTGADNSALESKLKELQAKLAEYEIIEDDIADLSIFKEENKKLKDEVAKLKAAMETAQTQVQAAQISVATAAPQVKAKSEEAPTKPVAPGKFELDPKDDVMNEFANAISGGAVQSSTPAPAKSVVDEGLVSNSPDATIADPQSAIDALLSGAMSAKPAAAEALAAAAAADAGDDAANDGPADPFGALDTDKMLAEVATLAETEGEGSSVLDEAVDTDKLMQEMGMESAPKPSPAVTNTPVSAPAAAAPAAPALKGPPVLNASPVAPEDDLLAEFKDADFESPKGAKGS